MIIYAGATSRNIENERNHHYYNDISYLTVSVYCSADIFPFLYIAYLPPNLI